MNIFKNIFKHLPEISTEGKFVAVVLLLMFAMEAPMGWLTMLVGGCAAVLIVLAYTDFREKRLDSATVFITDLTLIILMGVGGLVLLIVTVVQLVSAVAGFFF
jgi:hypothetical protein